MPSIERNTLTELGRRGLLKLLGTAGLGAALAPGRALAAPPLPARPATAIADWDGRRAVLATGPLAAIAAPPGRRIGACLMVAGGGGPRPAIGAVERAGTDLEGLAELASDPGVEQRVYRLLDALATPEPVELFGVSAEVGRRGIEPGQELRITWQVRLRGADVPHARLRQSLDRFHACVIGELAEGPTFTGQLSYVDLSRRV